MIDVPVSEKTERARWPRAGAPDFRFTVRSAGGQSLGNGVREYDWRMEVDARSGLLSVESFRADGNQPGQPIGVFRYRLTDEALRELQGLAVAARLGERRAPMTSHPGYTETEYVLTQAGPGGGRLVVNNDNDAVNEEIKALRYRVNEYLGQCFAHPERAAIVELTRETAEVFTLTVRNVGKEKICFTGPQWVIPTGLLQRAVLLVTEFPEEEPGGAPWPMDWREWPLAPMATRPMTEPLITMAPGAIWKAMAGVSRLEAGVRYLGYFSWSNYAGQGMVNGGYRIRGRMDSKRMLFLGGKR